MGCGARFNQSHRLERKAKPRLGFRRRSTDGCVHLLFGRRPSSNFWRERRNRSIYERFSNFALGHSLILSLKASASEVHAHHPHSNFCQFCALRANPKLLKQSRTDRQTNDERARTQRRTQSPPSTKTQAPGPPPTSSPLLNHTHTHTHTHQRTRRQAAQSSPGTPAEKELAQVLHRRGLANQPVHLLLHRQAPSPRRAHRRLL